MTVLLEYIDLFCNLYCMAKKSCLLCQHYAQSFQAPNIYYAQNYASKIAISLLCLNTITLSKCTVIVILGVDSCVRIKLVCGQTAMAKIRPHRHATNSLS